MIGHVPGPSALARALALVLLLAPLAAAQEEGQANGEGRTDPQGQERTQDRSALRFANLVPEGPTIDVLVGGEVVVEGLTPSSVSPYVVLPAGERAIEVVSRAELGGVEEAPAAGADPAEPTGAPADPAAAPTEPDPTQNPAAPAPATEEPQPAPVQDAVLLEQSVRLEAERYGTMILFRSAGAAQEDAAQEPEGQDVPAQADGAPAEDADAGARAGAAGGETPPDAAAPRDGPLPLQGRLVNDELGALPGAGRARVRVVHTAPDVGPVTVVAARAGGDEGAGGDAEEPSQQADGGQEGQAAPQGPAPIEGEELASALEANAAGAYATLPAGPHRLQVRVQDGTVAVDLDQVTFESGLLYTLYVSATDDAQTVVLTPAVDGGVSIERR